MASNEFADLVLKKTKKLPEDLQDKLGRSFSNFILEQMRTVANKNLNVKPNDFKDDDGFWVCSVCKQRMQSVLPNSHSVVYVPCLCDQNKLKEKQNIIKKNMENQLKDKARSDAFNDASMQNIKFSNSAQFNPAIDADITSYINNFYYSKKMGIGKIFYGNISSGKTHCSICLVNKLIDNGFSAKYMNLSRAVSNYVETKNAFLDYIKTFDLLVIDDFLDGSENDFFLSCTYQIVNSRFESHKPMIIITNLTLNQMKKHSKILSAKIFSKILDVCLPLEINGYQRKNKKI